MVSTDLDALVTLFRSTGGARWCERDDGDITAELAKWSGIGLNDKGRVVQLFLNENDLQGVIPEKLGVIVLLEVLNMGSNNLTGAIPASLGHLGSLQQLYLSGNDLTGEIPASLGQLVKLETLSLDRNNLSGHIPAELEALRDLSKLQLEDNQLSGPISRKLGSLAALQHLVLSNNQLSGSIPTELGSLSALQYLFLNGNRLTGPIPGALRALTKLETLVLSDNQLTGPVPPELGDLETLAWVNFENNLFSALWDHTQDVHSLGHEMGARSMPGGQLPGKLCRLLGVLDRARASGTFPGLGGNPWAEPPESIVERGPANIRSYFNDLYADPCWVQRSSIKIVLLGQGGAGKTSLRQSMKTMRPVPTGVWKEESTVFADVESMELEGSSVRVYDFAGQVAYAGLLQMFLTPRSVCVLVCNADAFGQQRGGDHDPLEKDCRKLEELCVCDWLRSISRRVPDNDVILVATKCDLAGGKARDVGRRMENACRTWASSWARAGMQPVRLEHGVCLTSCCPTGVSEHGEGRPGEQTLRGGWACDWRDDSDGNSSPSLLHRLVNKRDGDGPRGARMVLPRSWDIALTVLAALERGRDPVEMVVQKLGDPDGGNATTTAETKVPVYQGITVEELRAKWQQVVVELAAEEILVMNAENALHGALSIREFDGSLVRHETFVFLDVVWLARILKPLLNHKDEETSDGSVDLGDAGNARFTLDDPLDIASWGRLRNEGVLDPRLAYAMWPDGLSEYVVPTLASLGLAFSLRDDPDDGLVVLLGLKPGRPVRVGKVIDMFCSELTPAFSASWRFFLGVPPGAIEKVLTRCCSLGGVQTFWRYGVLVNGGLGDQDGNDMFAVVLEYSSTVNELVAQVYGDINTPAPWVALSYVMSAVSLMLLDFPGQRWRGSLKCPEHGEAMVLEKKVARPGDKFLEGSRCPLCSPDLGGLGAAVIDVVCMVDIRLDRDLIFRDGKERFFDLAGHYFVRRPAFLPHDSSIMDEEFALLAELRAEMGEIRNKHTKNEALVRELGAVRDGVGEWFDEMKGEANAFDITKTLLRRLENLQAPNYLYPRLVTVEEAASGSTPSRAHGMKRVLSKLRGVGKKEMVLHFLCPVDMTKVPCGYGGEGYRFRETRGWVKKISPVLQVAVVTATVALKATAGLNVNISEFLKDVKDGLVDELVDRSLDQEALFRIVSGEEDVDADMQKDTRASYEALKKLMDKEQVGRLKNARDGDGYIDFRDKMKRVPDGRGGMVWVRNENVQRWLDSHSNNAPSR